MISVHSPDSSAVFLYASRAFCRSVKVEPSRLLGVSLLNLVLSEDQPKVAKALLFAINNQECVNLTYGSAFDQQAVCYLESSARLGQQGIVLTTKLRSTAPKFQTQSIVHYNRSCEQESP